MTIVILFALIFFNRETLSQVTRLGSDVCVYSYFVPDQGNPVDNPGNLGRITANERRIETLESTVEFLKKQILILMQTVLTQKEISVQSNGTEQEKQKLQNKASEPTNTSVKSGVAYIRWGRTVCAQPSTLIYKGFAGGDHYTYRGGGSNYLCLPENPQWANYVEGVQHHGGHILGVEYEFRHFDLLFSKINNEGRSVDEHDAPCAVCLSSNRSSQIMIPARRECPYGWTMEYRGYLVSQHHTQFRTEFVCVDEEPEVLSGSHANVDGGLFYAVEGICGALPCPPYVNGRELTCVVCTR